MPGIKLRPLGLAMLALLLSLPAAAATDIATNPQPPTPAEMNGEAGAPQADSDATAGASAADDGADASRNEDVWQRIRAGFKFDDAATQNPLVALNEGWYAARPDYVRRMLDRSRPYLYHIAQEVDRRAMPMEIALLPMIESAFNSAALSPAAASGIWQFMPATARLYGLKQDNWYDGRRDFTASTSAALDYLSKLYLDFGDWQLALAAYNCGEGCVTRAIQKNVEQGLPTDYASLPLPNETRNYVPKLLAVKDLILHPDHYGVAIDTLPNQPYFEPVMVKASMDIRAAARLAGMSSNEFMALNAAFPRRLIRSDRPVSLLVPVDKADTFQHNLETGDWDTWQPYVAKKGEHPQTIAKRFNVSLARLEEVNQFHLKRGKLAGTQTILVPVKRTAVASAEDEPAAAEAPSRHVVQRGDTLFSIARRYGLDVADLERANPGLGGSIKAGQTLRLPSSAQAGEGAKTIQPVALHAQGKQPARATRYTARRGDSLHLIAQRFDVSVAELKAWNPAFRKSTKVRAGQKIVVGKP